MTMNAAAATVLTKNHVMDVQEIKFGMKINANANVLMKLRLGSTVPKDKNTINISASADAKTNLHTVAVHVDQNGMI